MQALQRSGGFLGANADIGGVVVTGPDQGQDIIEFFLDAGKIAVRMEGFSDEFSAILSRQIDEKVAQKA